MIRYQITIFSDGEMLDCINFNCYDDFSTTHKASRINSMADYDIVRLTRNGKKVKTFTK